MTLLTADRWLYEMLTTDSTLATVLGGRVFADVAPEDTAYPLAVISAVSSVPVVNLSAERVMDNELWQVQLITDQADYAALETAAERIRAILHRASGEGVIGCVEAGITRFSEVDNGRVYKHLVMEFRLHTQ